MCLPQCNLRQWYLHHIRMFEEICQFDVYCSDIKHDIFLLTKCHNIWSVEMSCIVLSNSIHILLMSSCKFLKSLMVSISCRKQSQHQKVRYRMIYNAIQFICTRSNIYFPYKICAETISDSLKDKYMYTSTYNETIPCFVKNLADYLPLSSGFFFLLNFLYNKHIEDDIIKMLYILIDNKFDDSIFRQTISILMRNYFLFRRTCFVLI